MIKSPNLKSLVVLVILPAALLCAAFLRVRAAGDWSPPINLSQSATDTTSASIAIDSAGRIHAVWSEGGEIFHRYKADGDWSTPAHVANGTSPDLAADASGHVHMVFANRFAANEEIYFVSWQEGGWGLPQNVSQTAGDSFSPRIAVGPDGELAVVWNEESLDPSPMIYIARSTDGVLWSVSPIPQAQGTHPVVAFGPTGNLLVAWQDPFDLGYPLEVFFNQWTGTQWTLPVSVSASPFANSSLPSIAVRQGEVYWAWQEEGGEGEMIYLSKMTDGDWGAPEKCSGAGDAFAPTVTFDMLGHGYLVWNTEDSIQYRAWDPSTDTWESIEDVARSQARATNAAIAVRDSGHVIWLADASTNNRDLFYSAQTALQPSPTPSEAPTATPTPPANMRIFLPLAILADL